MVPAPSRNRPCCGARSSNQATRARPSTPSNRRTRRGVLLEEEAVAGPRAAGAVVDLQGGRPSLHLAVGGPAQDACLAAITGRLRFARVLPSSVAAIGDGCAREL